MPTTRSGKGGRNRKRGKNEAEDEKREVVFKEDRQDYAQVLRMLDNGRCEAMCIDGTKRVCQIRGTMHKNLLISAGDIILVGLRDNQDDICHILKAYRELPESSRLNDGIAGELDEEDEAAGETLFEQNSHHLYSSGIKTSELQPQDEIKEMKKKKGNDSPPSKKQKKNKDSSSTPEIDDNPAVTAETTMLEVEIEAVPAGAEVRPDSESFFINEAGKLEIPPGQDISLRDDPFNNFGLEMSQCIHSQNDANYYASLSLPKFMKHFHNQVMIVDRMASHLGHSISKVLLQKDLKKDAAFTETLLRKEDLEKDAAFTETLLQKDLEKDAAFAEKDAEIAELKKQLSEKDAEIAELKKQLAEKDAEIAELKKQLAEKDEETAELKKQLAEKDAEIAELKRQLEQKASSSQELTVEEEFESLKDTGQYAVEMVSFLNQGFEMFGRAATRHLKDPASKDIVQHLDFDASHEEDAAELSSDDEDAAELSSDASDDEDAAEFA